MTKLSRRSFVGGAAAFIGAPALIGCATVPRRWTLDPFTLGVASGSPSPDGFVLWTRLAPEPLSFDPFALAGMRGDAVELAYEIAADPELRTIVARGTARADPAFAYSVHIEAEGLKPGRPYWYRFMSGDAVSRTGRAMTSTAPGAPLERFKFGFVSCSNYEHGYFAAYRHLADEQPDAVVYLGDYIYEYASPPDVVVRRHSQIAEITTLADYRNRYTQYRLDPDLQRLHAETTALMTWDDHEVQNDYADRWSEDFEDPERFLFRRAGAYQAYYEHMPVRALSRPNGPVMRVYDRYSFGDLVEIALIDGRQYRSRGACYAPPDKGGTHFETDASCPERLDERRSLLGVEQETWLYDRFDRSLARWNVLASDVMIGQFHFPNPAGEATFTTDDWNGYPAARTRLLSRIRDSRLSNPVTIAGDMHSFWANDLKLDFDNPSSPTVATEFVGTSVSAIPPPYEAFAAQLSSNPYVRFFESRVRGYASVTVDHGTMTTRFNALADVRSPTSAISTLKTFVIENGKAGLVAA